MKILIIKPSSLGDIIQANPVVPALRAAYPGAEISWLVFDTWAGIVSLFGGVDRIVPWRKQDGIRGFFQAATRIRKERFNTVIDLQGLLRTALLARMSGARTIVGTPGMKECNWLLVREAFPRLRSLHATDRALATVRYLTGREHAAVFSLAVPDSALQEAQRVLLNSGIGDAHTTVCVVPKARGAAKQWPIASFAELIRLLRKDNPSIRVVLLGAAGDGKELAGTGAVDLCGATSLQCMAAVLSRCSVVVGGDTGPVHCAAALGRPVVAVFGGSDVTETAPRGSQVTILKNDIACSPCRGHMVCGGRCPCLVGISPAEVVHRPAR